MLMCLWMVHGYFPEELSSYDRNHMARKAYNAYYLALSRKSLPAIEDGDLTECSSVLKFPYGSLV